LVLDPAPYELDALLERRRRSGLDRLDEVWEGVLRVPRGTAQRSDRPRATRARRAARLAVARTWRSCGRGIARHGSGLVLRDRDIAWTVSHLDPEPIKRHFVVIGNRRFPPKQVISAVTGLDRADFTTHQARRTLMGLGFSAGRRNASPPAARKAGPWIPAQGPRLGERLAQFSGQWVAIKDDDILHSERSPRELVGWLARHGQRADSMFRVPEDDRAASGLAPL